MFSRRSDIEITAKTYLIDPSTINTTDRAAPIGGAAQEGIRRCRAMIAQLEQYQVLLFNRVQELETAPYHYRVTLKRERRWADSKVTYHLIAEKIYDAPGIDPVQTARTTFPGKERHAALAAFANYQKAHPSIEAVLDIAKGNWER